MHTQSVSKLKQRFIESNASESDQRITICTLPMYICSKHAKTLTEFIQIDHVHEYQN